MVIGIRFPIAQVIREPIDAIVHDVLVLDSKLVRRVVEQLGWIIEVGGSGWQL